jgi:hypothetical protein
MVIQTNLACLLAFKRVAGAPFVAGIWKLVVRCEDYENEGPFRGTDFSRLTSRMNASFGTPRMSVRATQHIATSMRKCIS